MNYKKYLIILFSFLFLISFSEGKGVKKPKKKRVVLKFDDELIEGEVQKPDLFFLLQRKQFNYKRLIRLRNNFLPEMRADLEKIK